MLRPAGKAPLNRVNVKLPVPPLAGTWAEYGVPMIASGTVFAENARVRAAWMVNACCATFGVAAESVT